MSGGHGQARMPVEGASWRAFTAAPHRVMMLGGAVQVMAAMLLWTAELAGRALPGLPPLALALPPAWAHAFLMLYGTFTFYLFGFLMTTYPRWMGGPPVPRTRYVAAFLLLAGGMAALYVGLLVGARPLVVAGGAVFLSGFGAGVRALWAVYRAAPASADRFYETILNGVLLLAGGGMLAWLAAAGGAGAAWARVSVEIGLWWFLLPLLVTVGHRMIPFFSECVLEGYRPWRPRWTLVAMLAASLARGWLALAGGTRWMWLPDLALAALALAHSARWGLARSFSVRLLAVLHVAWLWLGIGMVLQLLHDLAILGFGPPLGRAPLHALGVGFVAGMTMAMATRVTLGHSGRPLVMDRLNWALFWVLMAAAAVRVAAELPPAAAALGAGGLLAAALLWLSAFGPWAARLLPIYLRPRADGRPG